MRRSLDLENIHHQLKNNWTNDKIWTDDKVPWPCYRSGSMVYFVNCKCASSLYKTLISKLEWIKTNTQQIDWDNDIVISHIRHPLIKHRKGIVEAMFGVFKPMLPYINTPDGIKFLSSILTLDDVHSYTIRQLLSNNACKVLWIPIDTDLDHKQYTISMFEKYGGKITPEIKDWWFSLPRLNESTDEELELYEKLINLPASEPLLRHIDFDLCLYNSLTVPVEPKNFRFRVEQIKYTLGLNEDQAIDQADREVFSGEYLKWTC
jgi:hypothetical protein